MRKLLLLLSLVFVASTAVAQKVTVNYDKNVDFSKFKTFSWTSGIPARNPFVNLMIVEGIESGFVAKGLSKVDKDGDLLLSLSVAVEVDLQVTHGSWGNTGSSLQTGIPSGGAAWDVRRGSIVLDLLDRNSQNLVWHGSANDTLLHEPTTDMNKDARRVEKQVKKTIEKLIKKYPARS